MMSIGGGEVGSTKELSSYNATEIARAPRTTTAKRLSQCMEVMLAHCAPAPLH